MKNSHYSMSMWARWKQNNRILLFFILAAFLMFAALAQFLWQVKSNLPNNKQPNTEQNQQSALEEINTNVNLFSFPRDLPQPQSAELDRQYKITLPSGSLQLTKILYTPKSVQEIFEYYKNEFQKSGQWQIVSEFNDSTQSNHKVLTVSGASGVLKIDIAYQSVRKNVKIDLSFKPAQ